MPFTVAVVMVSIAVIIAGFIVRESIRLENEAPVEEWERI